MGDKIMTPVVYQNRNGTESLYATHTVGNIHDGHGLPSPRWHQFTVTGNTIRAAPTQWQTMFSAQFSDPYFRWMPSLNVDRQGNLAIGYSISGALQSPLFPSIDYAGRLAADPSNWLGQGDARMRMGAGSQTHAGGRSGDYSAMFVDPSDGCTPPPHPTPP